MKRNFKVWLSMFGLAGFLVVLSGCGAGAPVVVGTEQPAGTLPAYTGTWLEKITENDTTKDQSTYYLDGTNIVAVKLPVTIGTADDGATQILNDTFVLGTETTLAKVSGSAQGTSVTVYINYKLESGQLTINGTNVTATFVLYISYNPTDGKSVTITRTLTGTLAPDGRTINFTHAKVESVPAQTSDSEKDVVISWNLQSGAAL